MRLLQSLSRGLDALDYLVAHSGPARLTDIAAHLGVDKSNASHLLRTLVASNYVEQTEGRRYRPTSKVQPPAAPSLEDIIAYRSRLHATLEQLVATTGECAHMAVLVGVKVWYVDKIDSPLPLKVDHPIGSLAPLHCTALGKAFLAFGDTRDTGALDAFTGKTITRKSALEAEIAATRERGYAVDDEEYTQGIRCAASPIFAPSGRMVAAIGLSGPTARIDTTRLAALGATVLESTGGHNFGVRHAL
jgi:DNA-binding IclR family transcriptional regulator